MTRPRTISDAQRARIEQLQQAPPPGNNPDRRQGHRGTQRPETGPDNPGAETA